MGKNKNRSKQFRSKNNLLRALFLLAQKRFFSLQLFFFSFSLRFWETNKRFQTFYFQELEDSGPLFTICLSQESWF